MSKRAATTPPSITYGQSRQCSPDLGDLSDDPSDPLDPGVPSTQLPLKPLPPKTGSLLKRPWLTKQLEKNAQIISLKPSPLPKLSLEKPPKRIKKRITVFDDDDGDLPEAPVTFDDDPIPKVVSKIGQRSESLSQDPDVNSSEDEFDRFLSDEVNFFIFKS